MVRGRTGFENPQWLTGRIPDAQVESAARELVEFAFRGFSR